MAKNIFPDSELPIRRAVELLPQIFQTDANAKFLAGVVDPLIQPGVLEKTVGYVGRRFGKTYNGKDIYLDSNNTLRSRYQLEPGVVIRDENSRITNFYDYIDFKNQLKFFNNQNENDSLETEADHFSWDPPIDWDKFTNFRQYYWAPSGPPPVRVLGQASTIVSTYKVRQGIGDNWIFTPDGLTNNPTINLYRGQTYKFNISLPGEAFAIRSYYDTGSLIFDPIVPYNAGQVVIYDGKLWKAKIQISPADGSSITLNSQDWEFIEDVYVQGALDYNQGIVNNGISTGTLTFEVPYNAPDVLYYQSTVYPDRLGRFIISDMDSNTKINVDEEILGKSTYTSSNGIEFTNGLIVEFFGNITPTKYADNKWLIEGVGTAITLVNFTDLVVPLISKNIPEILFDNSGFDTEPFDDASAYPVDKDYITINRSSPDLNPWSRYNRWFHISVLNKAHTYNGTSFDGADLSRAKRPIIEFIAGLQLYQHGSIAKTTVDYIDDFTSDVFSVIEGSTGYNIDGEELFEGARVLITADTDSLANNKIYNVKFIQHPDPITGASVSQITLIDSLDSASTIGETVLISRGLKNRGKMFYFTGTDWRLSQEKTKVQQQPLFDAFDSTGISFSNVESYPTSSFSGSEILSYAKGNGIVDTELGISLQYLNIDNVGDIQFLFNWDSQTFTYQINKVPYVKAINEGFYKLNQTNQYANGWQLSNKDYIQPILDSTTIQATTNTVKFNTVDWNTVDINVTKILFYVNGVRLENSLVNINEGIANNGTFVFAKDFLADDAVVIKIFSNAEPNQGYYEIPIGLEKNPLNQNIEKFTLGQAIDHVTTSLELSDNFVGIYPGVSNLRDIDSYQNNGRRFVKHAGIAPLAITLLCDRQINIIKSIEYALQAYTDFKNKFFELSKEILYNDDPAESLDQIISEYGKAKTENSAFVDSDMIGSGAYTELAYIVDDIDISNFRLSNYFDLNTLSRKAVYLYKNKQQLIQGRDYQFSENASYVTLLIPVIEGDLIVIREYVSTAFNFIPFTPTSLGLYKKYLPSKFIDDTYIEPIEVIRGHDGSITKAFGDYRDDILLELELRIYNNIKSQYNESIFNIDDVVGGYYGNAEYSKDLVDVIVAQDFLKWISGTNINYTINQYLDTENSFTYTYNNMTDSLGTSSLPGYWRGVYQWFYDTTRPHQCPWEMLGFSEKPTWWESEYGPAPYTRGNLILWEDLRDGIIRQGSRAGIYDRYKRASILSHIPTDDLGNLLSPLDSGLAKNFSLINNTGAFKLGDMGPVEYGWRSSSEWPFALVKALCLLKPFNYINNSFDISKLDKNIIGQTVNKKTRVFDTLDNFEMPIVGVSQSAGLVCYVINYLRSQGQQESLLLDKILGIDVNLTTRLSGFVDQTQQKYLLDSKSPRSSSSSIFIPPENYEIIFNSSTPVSTISYSGVLIEKTDGGWKITGYDNQFPYFNYFSAIESPGDSVIAVGGVSEDIVKWQPEKFYGNGTCIQNGNNYYRSIKSFTSGVNFNTENLKQIPQPSTVGSVNALYRKTFYKLRPNVLSYGEILPTIQKVVDFLLGYGAYLSSQGFVFDQYDRDNKTSQDWLTSSKEFMFWTKHNWDVGALISISPSASKVNVNFALGVADNLFDNFYPYQILKADGTALLPAFINVNRDFQNLTITVTNTSDGIYFFKAHFILKEHVTIFSDVTVFNDVIYNKPTGYRQDRIKSRGFRTVDWDGDYTSPGFIFDNVNIQIWSPFYEYRMGDIVNFKSINWTCKKNHTSQVEFNDSFWTKLDSTPVKQLIPNFDYKINQFEDYYNLDSDGLGSSQRDLGRHLIGYQTRDYLQNIAQDDIVQFQLYQGFIREKGTLNAITKIFDKLSKTDEDSIVVNEEWAFRSGRLGNLAEINETEFEIFSSSLEINPQPVEIINEQISDIKTDQIYRIDSKNFTLARDGAFTTSITPQTYLEPTSRIAGYVRQDQVDFVVKNTEELLQLDINNFVENSTVWITFDKQSWNVLRFVNLPLLRIIGITKNNLSVVITLDKLHDIVVDNIVGIKDIVDLEGFFKVIAVSSNTITVELSASTLNPEFSDSIYTTLNVFKSSRIENYNNLNLTDVAALPNSTKLWVDSNENQRWEVIEKNKQYSGKDLIEYGIETPIGSGTKVLYIEKLKQVISSMPATGYVFSYVETAEGLKLYQIISPPTSVKLKLNGSFGLSMAASEDGEYLIIGSPYASFIASKFMGDFKPTDSYFAGEIVLYNGKLWKAVNDFTGNALSNLGDSTFITFNTADWIPATLIEENSTGRFAGYAGQGLITIYKFVNNQWIESLSIVSPRPAQDEFFGSNLTIGSTLGKYFLAVSAVGARDNRGRVYLYEYDTITVTEVESAEVASGGSDYTVYEIDTVTIVDGGVGYNPESAGLVLTVTYLGQTATFTAEVDTETLIPGDNSVAFSVKTVTPLDRGLWIDLPSAPLLVTAEPSESSDGSSLSVGCLVSVTFKPAVIEPTTLTVTYDNQTATFLATIDSGIVTAATPISRGRFTTVRPGTKPTTSAPGYGSGATLTITYREIQTQGWLHLENTNYVGIYDGTKFYPTGSIVWQDNRLYQAIVDYQGDGSSIPVNEAGRLDTIDWIELDSISTQNSLPTNIALDDDDSTTPYSDSTIPVGLFTPDQISELVKIGDEFGTSLAMNQDGSILVVGSPNSDGQYFTRYKGPWISYQEYREGDVVLRNSLYYRLVEPFDQNPLPDSALDSTIVSKNQPPDNGYEFWQQISNDNTLITGKIYIYKRNANKVYELQQVITAENIEQLNLTNSAVDISAGDRFGFAMDINASGSVLVVSCPEADVRFQNQGSVFVFNTSSTQLPEYSLAQKLYSFEYYNNALFGSAVSIDSDATRIVVGAKNAPYRLPVRFDVGDATSFDGNSTTFTKNQGYTGQVYVFERKDNVFILAEKLEADLKNAESFGYSLDCVGSVIITGSPTYRLTEIDQNLLDDSRGMTRLFRKDPFIQIWNVTASQGLRANLELFKSIEIYDPENSIKLADIDIIDHAKLKILGLAEQEITYKTVYDPATYTIGADEQVVDADQAWFEKNVGKLWWDLSKVKWIEYEQGDLTYRQGHWNQMAYGSSIDVYEWVESVLLPSDWSILADTNEGLSEGISGQPLYPQDTVYSIKEIYNSSTGVLVGTRYYFWVKNKTLVPANVPGRRVSSASVSSLISSPQSSGIPIVALIDKDKFLFYNFDQLLRVEKSLFNIEFKNTKTSNGIVHTEYQLLTEGMVGSEPNTNLETKWIDSLVGFDQSGNTVPDPKLPMKQKYGLSFRPRQSMFKDNNKILKIVLDKVNTILLTRPFADIIDFTRLNQVDSIPASTLDLYDQAVDTYIDLTVLNTLRVTQASLRVNLVDAEVDTIDIINPGFGYKIVPPITIQGNGTGAKAVATLDNQGRISSVSVTAKGKKYTSATATARQFAVLVRNDETADGFWSIYSWDAIRKTFFRSASQGFDTTKYWSYTDWYAPGYSSVSRIVKEIGNLYEEPTIQIELGDILSVKEYGTGGWALLQKTQSGLGSILDNYNLVARQNGTIVFSPNLYSSSTITLGFDATANYDIGSYDLLPTLELRTILQAIKQDIFINDLSLLWNDLFFTSIRYAFAEQDYIDWAFKTSFINAIHNVGSLEEKTNYKNDNLDSYRNYIEEIKPYRTTIREYTSRYTKADPYNSVITDFDLPPEYSVASGKILPIDTTNDIKDLYPWKSWKDNLGFGITEILVGNSGAGYTSEPSVLITGSGSGATAQAYIANGLVVEIRVLTAGQGYITTPIISLIGGNGSNSNIATAIPVLGNSAIRSFDTTLKFDRITKNGYYQELFVNESITVDGTTSIFELKYAPTEKKDEINISLNDQILFNNEYEIIYFTSTNDTYSLLKAKLRLINSPTKGDVIKISYYKNDKLLDSVNRINKYYNPNSGMKGKSLSQLMTGIDYGGIQIQGTEFAVSGGWDALPWFSDGWDSVESNKDFYYPVLNEADGSTNFVELPTAPGNGQRISIYLKRAGSPISGSIDTLGTATSPVVVYEQPVLDNPIIRIDDPYFNLYDGSTVQPNGRKTPLPGVLMPTFIGDGVTKIINLEDYLATYPGDLLIFRDFESDGTVTINDPNIIDTAISGGTYSLVSGATKISPNTIAGAYSTALGTLAEEIQIDGGKLISPDQVPATEENVPGQVLESISIKVFSINKQGAAPINATRYFSDGSTRVYDIGLSVIDSQSVIVYVDKIRQGILATDSSIDYSIAFTTNQVEFVTAPDANSLIEIVSIGVGGVEILDYQEFIADGDTSYFLTKANYQDTQSIVVTVDGNQIDTGFVNSTDILGVRNKTLVEFAEKPEFNQSVKIICLGAALDTDSSLQSIIRTNRQIITVDGSTRSYDLDYFVSLSRNSVKSSAIVELNNVLLKGVDTSYEIYDGTNNQIVLGLDPEEAIGTITSNNIKVYVNNQLLPFLVAYTYNGITATVTISTQYLTLGDAIKIENDVRTQYSFTNNNIEISSAVTINEGDTLTVTWFSEYPTMDIISDQYTGGKSHYKLAREPVNSSYVWVYKNGIRLTSGQDYSVSLSRLLVYIKDTTVLTDEIRIIQFGSVIYKKPQAYEIFKDMLNVHHYKRYSIDNNIKLSKNLNYYDQSIEVTDASQLDNPVSARNIPGIIEINGEKIEYFIKSGNTLSQLRRGSFGTAIKTVHEINSYVINVGLSENIPYREQQEKTNFISDGSTTLVGPLTFVPNQGARTTWNRGGIDPVTGQPLIPTTYGPSDEIEVFVGGIRLKKDPVTIYTEINGSSSQTSNEILPAEFSVDGLSNYVRLTYPVNAGTRITIIRRIGSTWYDRGETTASNGVTITENTNPIATFLKQKVTELPE